MSYLGGRTIYIDSDGNEHFDYERDYEPKPITNYDRIRSMSTEELAEYIRVFFPEVCPPGNCPGEDYCYKCWLDWLKQEADHA